MISVANLPTSFKILEALPKKYQIPEKLLSLELKGIALASTSGVHEYDVQGPAAAEPPRATRVPAQERDAHAGHSGHVRRGCEEAVSNTGS